MSTLQSLLVKIQGDTTGINHAFQETEQRARGLQGILRGALGTALGFSGAQAGLALASRGFGLVKSSVIGMNSSLETSTLQFETLMGDADKAKAHVLDLFEIAKKTPFETGPIIEASRMLQTFGGNALNTRKNILMIGDASAAVAAPINEVSFWVGRAYSAIQGGRPFGEASARLQELAIMSPKARTEMERLQKAGASSAEVWAVLEKDLGKFTGAMEKQASTWSGLVSTLTDTIALSSAKAFAPLFDVAKAGVSGLITVLSSPKLERGVELISKGIAVGVRWAGERITNLTKTLEPLTTVVGQVASGAQKMLAGFGIQDLTDVQLKIGDLKNAFKAFRLGELEGIDEQWRPLRAALSDIGMWFGTIRDRIGEIVQGSVMPLLTTLSGELRDVFSDLVGRARDLFDRLVELAGTGGINAVGEAIMGALNVLDRFLKWLNGTGEGSERARKALLLLVGGFLALKGAGIVVGILQGVAGAVKGIADIALGPLQKVTRNVLNIATGIKNVTSKSFTIVGKGLDKVLDNVRAIGDGLKNLGGKSFDVAVNLTQGAGAAAGKGGDILSGLFDRAVAGLSGAVAGLLAAGLAGPIGTGLLAAFTLGAAALVAALPAIILGIVVALVVLFPEQAGYIAGAILGMFVQAVSILVGTIATIFIGLAEPIISAISQAFTGLGEIIGALLSGNFERAFQLVVAAIKGLFIDLPLHIIGWIGQEAGKLASGAIKAGQGLVEGFAQLLRDIFAGIGPWAEKMLGGFTAGFGQWIGEAGRQGIAFVTTIFTELFKMPGKLGEFLTKDLVPALQKWAEDLARTGREIIGKFINGIFDPKDGLISLPGKLWNYLTKELLPGIGRWAGEMIKKGADLAGDFIGGLINGLASLPGKLMDEIRKAFESINIVVGPFHISGRHGVRVQIDLPQFAGGAYKLPATMPAIVHKGEMIIPADIAARLRGEGGRSQSVPRASASIPAATNFGSGPLIGQLVYNAPPGEDAHTVKLNAERMFDALEEVAFRRGRTIQARRSVV